MANLSRLHPTTHLAPTLLANVLVDGEKKVQ